MLAVRHALPTVVLPTLLAISLSACSGTSVQGDRPGSGESPHPITTPSSAGAGAVVRMSAPIISQGEFAAQAVARWGQPAVERAYDEAADLNAREDLQPDRLSKADSQIAASDFVSIRSMMTPSAMKSWDQSIAGRASKANRANVFAISFYSVIDGGYRLRTDIAQPPVEVTNGKVSLQPGGQSLVVVMDVDGVLRYTDPKGKFVKMPLKKTVTFWMVRGTSSGAPWLIDGWQSRFQPIGTVADVR